MMRWNSMGAEIKRLNKKKRKFPCKNCGSMINNNDGHCYTCTGVHRRTEALKHGISTEKRRAIEEHQDRPEEDDYGALEDD